MLNCRGPGSRDDDALRTAKAPRGGATGPRQRDVVAGGSGTENAYQHVGSSLSVIRFASVNRALTTLNGRRQTNVRVGRREAVSPLFMIVTRGFCISGSLSEKERD